MPDPHRHYQDPGSYLYRKVLEAIAANDPETLSRMVVAVSMHDDDYVFARSICRQLVANENATVRGNTILGLGHLARRFRRLDATDQGIIENGLRDPDNHVRGQAWAAAEDVSHFLGWKVTGFDFGDTSCEYGSGDDTT